MDVSIKEDIIKLVKFVEEREKTLDILINNVSWKNSSKTSRFFPTYGFNYQAGRFGPDPASTHNSTLSEAQAALFNLDPEEWKQKFIVNGWAPFTVTGGFLHLLGEAAKRGDGRGCVINISSIAGKIWNPWWSIIGEIILAWYQDSTWYELLCFLQDIARAKQH